MKNKKPNFDTSLELRQQFKLHFEEWSKRNRAGLSELAERCGVSTQYLSHVGRYGRVPSRPIMILLAFNFQLTNPAAWFGAAGFDSLWPYEPGLQLRQAGASESGFLSVQLDMQGFTAAIREIVKSEIRPQSLPELLNGRPLRVGCNIHQTFLFKEGEKGFFHELIHLLALSLHIRVELIEVSHVNFIQSLHRGEIDIYGPIYFTTPRIGHALFTKPFCRVPLAALWRRSKARELPDLPNPKKVSELRRRDYRIAVHKDSMSHHFAVDSLALKEDQLVLCESAEESFERILMDKIPRPTHLVLTDLPHARAIQKEHSKKMELLFIDGSASESFYEDTIAVRKDWTSVVETLNSVLEFMMRNSTLARLAERTLGEDDFRDVIF